MIRYWDGEAAPKRASGSDFTTGMRGDSPHGVPSSRDEKLEAGMVSGVAVDKMGSKKQPDGRSLQCVTTTQI